MGLESHASFSQIDEVNVLEKIATEWRMDQARFGFEFVQIRSQDSARNRLPPDPVIRRRNRTILHLVRHITWPAQQIAAPQLSQSRVNESRDNYIYHFRKRLRVRDYRAARSIHFGSGVSGVMIFQVAPISRMAEKSRAS